MATINISGTNLSPYAQSMNIKNNSADLQDRKIKYEAINEAADQQTRVRSYKREEFSSVGKTNIQETSGVDSNKVQNLSNNQIEKLNDKIQESKVRDEKLYQKYVSDNMEYTKGSIVSAFV